MGEIVEFDEAKLFELIDPSDKESVSEQLERKIDITQVSIRKCITPLHIAVFKNDTGFIKFLLEYAKKHLAASNLSNFINAQDIEGNTALHVAAINGSIDHVKALLHTGAIYKIKNKKGKTPRDLASNQTTRSFLECTDKFFKCAKQDKIKFKMLRELDNDELSTIMNARNTKGCPLREIGLSREIIKPLRATIVFLNDLHGGYDTVQKVMKFIVR